LGADWEEKVWGKREESAGKARENRLSRTGKAEDVDSSLAKRFNHGQ
jgi:hypothetical protein